MRYVVIAFLLIAAVIGSVATSAYAETPTPSATATPAVTATPTPVDMQLNFTTDPLVMYWESVPGAVAYHLYASVWAVEVNAGDPFCTRAAAEESQKVDIDSDLPASPQTYEVSFPAAAPGDRWFVYRIEATILALGEGRGTTGTSGIGYVAETLCGGPVSPPEATVFTDDTSIGGCVIPAGFIEVTTQAALDHGQRVFEDANTQASRIYVHFRTGGCDDLAASTDMPLPEFVPSDEPLSPPSDVLSPPSSPPLSPPVRNPGGAVSGPDTGSQSGEAHHALDASSMLIVAASAIVLAGGGLALRRTRRR